MIVNSGIAERCSVMLLSTLAIGAIRYASSAILWTRGLASVGKRLLAFIDHLIHALLCVIKLGSLSCT
jgi:hypothetical protein